MFIYSFPGATNQSLLTKFNYHHKSATYYQVPQLKEEAFIIVHYAGKVKYQIKVSCVWIINFHLVKYYTGKVK